MGCSSAKFITDPIHFTGVKQLYDADGNVTKYTMYRENGHYYIREPSEDGNGFVVIKTISIKGIERNCKFEIYFHKTWGAKIADLYLMYEQTEIETEPLYTVNGEKTNYLFGRY